MPTLSNVHKCSQVFYQHNMPIFPYSYYKNELAIMCLDCIILPPYSALIIWSQEALTFNLTNNLKLIWTRDLYRIG